jgi:hypothetical protein
MHVVMGGGALHLGTECPLGGSPKSTPECCVAVRHGGTSGGCCTVSPLFSCRLSIFIAFSTANGFPARTSFGERNSVFTAALLKYLRDCGSIATVNYVLTLVREEVGRESARQGRQQFPWHNVSPVSTKTTLLPPIWSGIMSPSEVEPFPIQVPPKELFCGRQGTLEALLQRLSSVVSGSHCSSTDALHVCAITGLGGVGKSATIRELCRHLGRSHSFQTGVFWIDADCTISLDVSFRGMAIRTPLRLTRCSEEDVTAEEIRREVLAWLEGHHDWLLVFDNCDNLSALKPFLPRYGHVVLTTRVSIDVVKESDLFTHGFVWGLTLDILNKAEALSLLLSVRDGMPDAKLEGEERDAARWLVGPDCLQGHPLALQQAGAYIKRERASMLQYKQRFLEIDMDLFGAAPRRQGVEAWLVQVGLPHCVGPITLYGIFKLDHFRCFKSVSELRDLHLPSELDMKRLWYHLCELWESERQTVRRSVRTTWTISVSRLSSEARMVMYICALASPSKVPVELVVRSGCELVGPLRECLLDGFVEPLGASVLSVCSKLMERCGRVIAELVDLSLVGWTPKEQIPVRCINMHRLLQATIAESTLSLDFDVRLKAQECQLAVCKAVVDGLQAAWISRAKAWLLAVQHTEVWCAMLGKRMQERGPLLHLKTRSAFWST